MCLQCDECFCICLTEHWKNAEQLKEYNFSQFKIASSFCRDAGKHGGSAIYLKKGQHFKNREDITSLSKVFVCEVSAAEVVLSGKKLIIICVYRPPSSDVFDFFDIVEKILEKIIVENCEMCFAGDFNIDLLSESNQIKNYFLSLLSSFGLDQSVFACTRESKNSNTCLDYIFTNIKSYEIKVVENHISDHKSVILKFLKSNLNTNYFKFIRSFNSINKELFRKKLSEQDWLEMYICPNNDVNLQWRNFFNVFYPIFNECFPKQKVYLKNLSKNLYKDPEVQQCKHELDILYVLSKNNPIYTNEYNNSKKRYNLALKNSRKSLYSSQLTYSQNKSKTVWNIINEIRGCDKSSQMQIPGNPQEIANDFNDFSINIVPNLLSKLVNVPFKCDIPVSVNSLFISSVNETEICDIIKKLKGKLSSGYDDIPTTIIKYCVAELSAPLSFLVNNSLIYGIFPDPLKQAIVSPILKKGDPSLIENYRPISLLPSFSKVFESAMCARLSSYFKCNNLFSRYQHAYLEGESIDTAVYSFIQNILEGFENKHHILGMYLDLSKAFDCVNYHILFEKLQRYGVRGCALQWIVSYLSNRSQKVKIQQNSTNYYSNPKDITVGVPQGSVIGPLLFVIYINDIQSLLEPSKIHLTCFADDTNFILKTSSNEQITEKCNTLLINIKNYMSANKLFLNEQKTNLMQFKTIHSHTASLSNITLDQNNVLLSSNVKFLGLIIDENLTWKYHIEFLVKKLSQINYSMRVLSSYVDQKTINIIYNSNFKSRLRYGVIFWGKSCYVEQVFIEQKRAIRIILGLKNRESCRSHFKNLNLLTLTGLYIYETILFLKSHPTIFKSFKSKSNRTLNYNVPTHKLNVTEKGCFYSAILFFNKLPQELKKINNYNTFKANLYNYICNIEPYSCNEFFNYTK